jgi:hypothetical protein
MLAVVRLRAHALDHPPSMRTLARMAAKHELVLVCGHETAARLVGALRLTLGQHPVVALLVDGDLMDYERNLLQDLLNNGTIPVILTIRDPAAVQLTGWLDPDSDVALPINARAA